MFTVVGGHALTPTAGITAFLVSGTVAVKGAYLPTVLWSKGHARTHSTLFFGNISVSSDCELRGVFQKAGYAT